MHSLDAAVGRLVRSVAAEIVMPHFRALSPDQIVEKEPGDLVTVADRLAEVRLAEGLQALVGGSSVVGEEGVAADPASLAGIADGAVWIVDPIDGTGNYAAGRSPFAIMVALAGDGVVQAGWIFDPVADRLVHATLGGGAFVDGERVYARATGADVPLLALATRFLPPDVRADYDRRTAGTVRRVATPLCAGEQYPRLVLGENDMALFWRAHSWDHAAGGLFLEEAGGRLARFDGSPYRIDSSGIGLIAAASPALWDRAAAILVDL